jgi:putative transposase
MIGHPYSGYYKWQNRGPSKRDRDDEMLTEKIRQVHAASRGTYGAPRVHAELRAEAIRVGKKRVARLMREAGLRGVSRRKRPATTVRSPVGAPVPDLIERDFTTSRPNELWVADITYVPTAVGFLYVSVVIDAFSRRVVGWAMANHLRKELVVGALEMALGQRSPESDLIHHSDRGSQYTSIAFGKRCKKAGVRPSMGSCCYDNALCESFFATLECELVEREQFTSRAEARMAIFEFIEGWYNPRRRHSALDYESPIRYEQHHAAETNNRKSYTVH